MKSTETKKGNKKYLKIVLIICMACAIIFGVLRLCNGISDNGKILAGGRWYNIQGVNLKFSGTYWQYMQDNDDNPPDYYWDCTKHPFYVMAGDKIITFGLGVQIIDIEEISKERIILKYKGESVEFTNSDAKRTTEGLSEEDKKELALLKNGTWKSVYGRMEFSVNEYKLNTYYFLDDFGGVCHYYYDYLGDGVIEVRYGDTIERLIIVSIDNNKLVMDVRGEKLEFEHPPAEGYRYYEHLCLCDDCKSVLYGDKRYDEVRGTFVIDTEKKEVWSGETNCHEDYGPLSNTETTATYTSDTKFYIIEREEVGKCICKELSAQEMSEILYEYASRTSACFWLDPQDKSKVTKIVFPRIRK